jgi:1-acyl-sn-glycerol-3-phosphate acyltransferase
MQKALGWLLTPLHLLLFALILLAFHPAQVVALRFGYAAHKKVADYLQGSILAALRVIGTRIRLHTGPALDSGRPLIVVANHQSMYDIPMLAWALRQHHPKFIAKRELGRRLPSVSYNLRHGGSVLIDRDDAREALPALRQFGRYIEEHRYAACIFPEGTRAADGVMKPFRAAGLLKLLRAIPNALVVPVAIEGSWKLVRYGLLPMPFGTCVNLTVLPAIDARTHHTREAVELAERAIRAKLEAKAGTELPLPAGQRGSHG